MLRLWGRKSSVNVQKALWLAFELGLELETPQVGGSYGGLDHPAYAALTPMKLIPVLQDGELAIWESHAILRYLAAKYGAPEFWPETPADRSWQDRWMEWSQAHLQPTFMNGVFWGLYRTPEAQRDLPAIERAVVASGQAFTKVEEALADGRVLGGASPSLADIPIGALLYRYFSLDIARPPLPRLEDWYARLCDRPAYRNSVMTPFDELKGRLSF